MKAVVGKILAGISMFQRSGKPQAVPRRSASGRQRVAFSRYERLQLLLVFNSRRRRRSLEKIAMYLDENVQIVDALDQMTRYAKRDGRDPSNLVGRVYQHWANLVADGIPFSQAILGFIPDRERQLIVAAERSSRLVLGIREAVELRAGMDEIIKVIRSAVTYPVLAIAFVLGCLAWMSFYVFPEYREVLKVELWPPSVARLAGLADWVVGRMWLVLILIGAGGWAFVWSLPNWVSSLREKAEDFAPYSIYRMLYGTVLLLSYAGFVRAGYNMNKSLEVLLQSASKANPWYADKLRRLRAEGARGAKDLGDALHSADLNFPDREIVGDLRTFSKGRNFDEMLGQIARTALRETIDKIGGQVRVLRIAVIFMIAGVALWFVSAVFDFQRVVSSAAQLG